MKHLKEIKNKIFSGNIEDFKGKLDVLFNKLNVIVDPLDVYESGVFMSVSCELTDFNKNILKSVIIDYDLYKKVTDENFSTSSENKKNVIDLTTIVEFLGETSVILYDEEKEVFYYEDYEDLEFSEF